jgi:DoxX-like family
MFSAYVLVTAFTAVANTFSATCDLVRYEQVAVGMARAGVPESWMTMLGVLKMAGALGVLVGIVVPALGVAAAGGLALFFVGAILTHLRVRDFSPSLGLAGVFLALAVGSFVTRLAA